jgi:hypothetical protein
MQLTNMTINIDVVNMLNSPAVVGRYRGMEVKQQIERQMDETSNDFLVLIDLRKANPLQYEFCQYAFGPLIREINSNRWSNKHVIFQMQPYHESGYFRGVLKYLGTELSRKESEKGFVLAGFYTNLIIGDENCIRFIGNLNADQRKVLDEANRIKVITAKEVVSNLGLSEEVVVQSLGFLVTKHFLMISESDSGSTHHYYSFYNYFKWS